MDDWCDRGIPSCSPCIRKRMDEKHSHGMDPSDIRLQCQHPFGKAWEELEYAGKLKRPASDALPTHESRFEHAYIGRASPHRIDSALPHQDGPAVTKGAAPATQHSAGPAVMPYPTHTVGAPPAVNGTPTTGQQPGESRRGSVALLDDVASAEISSRRKRKSIAAVPEVSVDALPSAQAEQPGESNKRKRKHKQDTTMTKVRSQSSGLPADAASGTPVRAPPATAHKPPIRPADDPDYLHRIRANNERAPLTDVTRPAPVWASRRRALTTSLDYFTNPVSTFGATVDVGAGGLTGMARMILLEGDTGEDYVFWGTKKSLGTIVVPVGRPRPTRESSRPMAGCIACSPSSLACAGTAGVVASETNAPLPLPHESTYPNLQETNPTTAEKLEKLVPDIRVENRQNSAAPQLNALPMPGEGEEPAIAALLLAHRSRTPVAVAVAEDYAVAPWLIPRAFIVLGWFWITDAWPEPQKQPLVVKTGDRGRDTVRAIRWRFRFDWCHKGQEFYPWWERPEPGVRCLYQPNKEQKAESYDDEADEEGYRPVLRPGLSPTETVRLPKRNASGGIIPPPESRKGNSFKICETCWAASLEVYAGQDLCLNEQCPQYWYEPGCESACFATSE